MDSSRFDEFTKLLARSSSRRQVLKGMAASVVGSVLSFVGMENTFASTCTGGLPGQPCAATTPHCCNNSTCSNGTCVCQSGLTQCGSTCVNLQTNAKNCGACGHACLSGQVCVGGVCTGCQTGQVLCNGTCVNLNTDAHNCGSCGNVCQNGSSCQQGVCRCTSGDIVCNGTCVNPNTDNNNCGSCGNICQAGTSCKKGICCPTGQANCNGVCTNLHTDPSNCGSCGHICAAGETCVKGACTCGSSGDCPAGQNCCSGTCVNEQSDPNNCGACGHVCPAGQTCSGGTCVTPCHSNGTTCVGNSDCCSGNCCSGTCVNEQSDPNNCGACGHVCSAPNVQQSGCSNGTCVILACSPGFLDCNGVYADGCETNITNDPNNCGTCRKVCNAPNVQQSACSGGTCVIVACSPGFADCNGIYADGCETNITNDPNNCGGCGIKCINGVCLNGVCF